MKAIVRFHIGKKIYEIGEEVPESVWRKYPHLVGVTFQETEKKEMTIGQEKEEKPTISKRRK